MKNTRKVLFAVSPALIGTLTLVAFLISTRSAAHAEDASAVILPPRPAVAQAAIPTAVPTVTSSLTETVIGRLSVLLAKPILTSAYSPLPPGTTLADVNVATDVVTVVLNLPESVLYNEDAEVGSDTINMAVVQSLDGLPLTVYHVLTVDPRNPQAAPKAISSFVHLRPVTSKPYENVPVSPTVQSEVQPQAASATAYALSGKSVYLSAGHGWYYNTSSGWSTQRLPYIRPFARRW